MMVPRGQLVVAASPGTVTGARWDGTGLGGWCVVIDGKGVSSKRTYRFLYAHLMLPPFVKAGAHVEAGSLLGVSGDTGGLHKAEGARFTGAHLHFSCATEGSYIDMTAQMAELVRALKPGVYALPKDEDGAITSAALQSIAVAADAAPDWYIKQLATAER